MDDEMGVRLKLDVAISGDGLTISGKGKIALVFDNIPVEIMQTLLRDALTEPDWKREDLYCIHQDTVGHDALEDWLSDRVRNNAATFNPYVEIYSVMRNIAWDKMIFARSDYKKDIDPYDYFK